jgi:anthranilate phosphoribosyltransferase
VHGTAGLDEISPIGSTTVIELRGSAITRWEIEPEQLGFRDIAVADLAGGEPAENAALIERVLLGTGPKGAEAAVLLNAGAAHYVAGLSPSMKDAVGAVRVALAAGKGREALGRLRGASAAQR